MEITKKITRLFDIIVCVGVVGIIGFVSFSEQIRASVATLFPEGRTVFDGTITVDSKEGQLNISIQQIAKNSGEMPNTVPNNGNGTKSNNQQPKNDGVVPKQDGSGETSKIDPAKVYAIFVTSYNAEKGQTDNSPCVGSSGMNQCELAKKGVRMLALSQDLIGRASWKPFHYGETVIMKSDISDSRCNGEFLLVDTMNKRYKNRGDLFFMNRKDNISCQAWIYKK